MDILRVICIVLITALSLPCVQSSPKREMRGVWVATVWGLDWPSVQGTDDSTVKRQKEELTSLLDSFKALNLTTVCLQVRPMGDVLYKSSLEPWSSFLTGHRGEDPGWDPLEFAVDECHRRGLELYAWVNPFRWSTGTDYNTDIDRRWKRNGWLLSHGKYTVFNPGIEQVRAHIVDICHEIVDGYDVDGLVFDDYFYPNRIPADKSAPDYHLYQAEAPWMDFADWRRACIHKVVADVKAMIADTRPGCRFGISPAGVAGKRTSSADKWGMEPCRVRAADWQYNEIFSDPIGMMYQGTIDFVSPQIYWPTTHSSAPFTPLAKWWAATACHFGTHLYSSITLERIDKGNIQENIRDTARQIDAHRAVSFDGKGGVMIYSSRFLPKVSGVLSSRFETPCLPPVSGPESEDRPSAPVKLRLKDGKLKWEETEGEPGEIVRYTVYALPPEVSKEEASDPDGDGIDVRYLLGVTYVPEYEVARRGDGWRYAVCAYTPQSAEGTPAWLE
ncbi:MAG: family 10 glycosylhydrolase [Muribaculaceae bacterium]|nr:family 10 glycosylhydrolase [Muribaculaceae bacterium]